MERGMPRSEFEEEKERLTFSDILKGIGGAAKWFVKPTPTGTQGFYGSSPLQAVGDTLRLISSAYQSPEALARTQESIEKQRYMRTQQQAQRAAHARALAKASGERAATEFSQNMQRVNAMENIFSKSHEMLQRKIAMLDPESEEDKAELAKLREAEKSLYEQRAKVLSEAGITEGALADYTSLLTTGKEAAIAKGAAEAAAIEAKVKGLVPSERGRERAKGKAVGLEPETRTRHIVKDGRKFQITERYDPSTDRTEILTWRDTETLKEYDPGKILAEVREAGLEIEDGKIVGTIPPKLIVKRGPMVGEDPKTKEYRLKVYKEARDNADREFRRFWSDVGVGESELPGLKRKMTDSTFRLSRAMYEIDSFLDMEDQMTRQELENRLKIIFSKIGKLRNIAVLNPDGKKVVFAKEGLDKWIADRINGFLASLPTPPENVTEEERAIINEDRRSRALAAVIEELRALMDMNNEAYKEIITAERGEPIPTVKIPPQPIPTTPAPIEEEPEQPSGFTRHLGAAPYYYMPGIGGRIY